MKNVELKQQAIAYIEQLSIEKLETALNYLAALGILIFGQPKGCRKNEKVRIRRCHSLHWQGRWNVTRKTSVIATMS